MRKTSSSSSCEFRQNDQIRIQADGPDEEAAIADLTRLVQSNFEVVNEKVKI